MRNLLRVALFAAASAAAASLLNSCVYDPYGYSPGYTTGSVLVSTSSSYWGYDPYRYAYYDYRRRCYYDPYLRGYYPVGYRPPAVVGCPHPRGWRPGRGVCPAPHNARNHHLGNHLNRLHAMRGTGHSWARHVNLNNQSQHSHMRQNPNAWQNRARSPATNRVRPAGVVGSGHGGTTWATAGSSRRSGGAVTTSGGSHRSGMRSGATNTGTPPVISSRSGASRSVRGTPSAASRMAAMQSQARAQAAARASAAAASRAAASRAAASRAAASRAAASPPPSYKSDNGQPSGRPGRPVTARSGGARGRGR